VPIDNDQCSQRLEDNFDGSTRENLRHIILCKDEDSPYDEKLSQATEERTIVDNLPRVTIGELHNDNIPRYILSRQESNDSDVGLRKAMTTKKPLARIPTCAIFHKLTTGRGVPHSFASEYLQSSSTLIHVLTSTLAAFLRQWPALPRIVVSLYFLGCPNHPKMFVRSSFRFVFSTFHMSHQASGILSQGYALSKVR
jgi:KUP system potassium uptake protein